MLFPTLVTSVTLPENLKHHFVLGFSGKSRGGIHENPRLRNEELSLILLCINCVVMGKTLCLSEFSVYTYGIKMTLDERNCSIKLSSSKQTITTYAILFLTPHNDEV